MLDALELERLKPGVCRLRIGANPTRSVLLKCLKPALAQTDRLVAERWLPALGFEDRAPRLLGAAAQRDGCWVWHAYEDIGDAAIKIRRDPPRLAAAIALIAKLHTRAAGHRLIPEIRWRARDHGVHFFTANLNDALAAVDALAGVARSVPAEFVRARTRLLEGMYRLRDDAPRRARLMAEVGGPDTLLHGDLWPENVFVSADGNGLRARLIDWDHVGAGPFTYDLSTFLYCSSPEERPWILQQYREAVEREGWRLPPVDELNLLFHTAESSRQLHCLLFAALALLHDDADWAIDAIVDWDRWFEALRPPLPD
jgi:hypothetical protein